MSQRSKPSIVRAGLVFACGATLLACGPVPEPSVGRSPEALPDDVYALDRPPASPPSNPDFVPEPVSPSSTGVRRFGLRTEGEVIVLEGDSTIVSSGGGAFGITDRNQVAIVREVLSEYPDRFDTIAIFLSFLDQNHAGSAYYQNVKNEVQGIGRNVYDGRDGWGLPPEGRFSGFVNMNTLEQFGGLRGAGSVRSGYHAVLAQELSHRWLMFFQFTDATGMPSQALLGRQDAHWSPLIHAYGSVQDGLDWRDNGDGSFTVLGQENGFAPMDLYGMGIYGPDQVEPFYQIVEASLGGMMLDKSSRIPVGSTIMGRRIDIGIDQVISAMGPRNPPKGTETPYYRSAFVLVTAPGQAESAWRPYLEAVQAAQRTFPETWRDWTLRAGAMCTKVSEPCPEPLLGLHGFAVDDGDDDLVGPGDAFDLGLDVRNDGLGTAENVAVTVTSLSPGVTVASATVSVPAVPEAGVAAVPGSFRVTLGPELECGTSIRLQVRTTSQEGPSFVSPLETTIGNRTLKLDRLDEAPDWTVDPDGTDTAEAGRWALGEPEFVSVLGVITQPATDHSAGDGKLSFHTGPAKGSFFADGDVDGGTTTLESPVFSIGGARYPSLVYYAWRVAQDFSMRGGPVPVAGADLVVQASNDGGVTWVEIDRITEDTEAWTRRVIPLPKLLAPSNRMRFRFSISDPSMSGIVEAGIDDLEIIDILDGCPVPDAPGDPMPMPTPGGGTRKDDEGGCAASAGPADRSSALAAVLLIGLGLALRVRRRR